MVINDNDDFKGFSIQYGGGILVFFSFVIAKGFAAVFPIPNHIPLADTLEIINLTKLLFKVIFFKISHLLNTNNVIYYTISHPDLYGLNIIKF